MNLLRRPVLWATMLAAVFAFTIGSQSPSQRELAADKPSLATVAVVEPEAANRSSEGVAAEPRLDTVTTEKSVANSHSVPVLEIASDPLAEQADVGGPTEDESERLAAVTRRPQVVTYVVQPGETLASIASRFEIDQETILAANDLGNANLLRSGQQLKIPTMDGALHHVRRGESLWLIARMYRADLDEIVSVNEITDPNRVVVSQEIFIPGKQAASIGREMRSERVVGSDGRLLRAFDWPVTGRISSGYGPRWGSMHHGVDVAVPTGTPVRVAAAGRVSFSGWNGGYGYLVVIDHGDRVETRYAHNSRLVVSVGQQVRRGDIIAYSGNTGRSTGPHVHFEIRQNGQSVNPINYLR